MTFEYGVTEHNHTYVIATDGDVSELVCECGAVLRSVYGGAVVVEDE